MEHECENHRVERIYANRLEVGHNAYEFVLDFGTQEHEGPETRLHTGIVTSPGYAQAFAETLSDALAKYRETYGSIPAEEPRAAKGQ